MKKIHVWPRLKLLQMLMLGLAACGLSACCDGEVYISGITTDANTGIALDSVQFSLFRLEKKTQVRSGSVQYSDSTGSFFLWEFGYCGNEKFSLVASKQGYYSQLLAVEHNDEGLQINLIPE